MPRSLGLTFRQRRVLLVDVGRWTSNTLRAARRCWIAIAHGVWIWAPNGEMSAC